MVLATAFIVMLPLYWLIGIRILYNIPIGEKIFLFKNDYAYINSNKSSFYINISIINPLYCQYISLSKNISKFKYFALLLLLLLFYVCQCTALPLCKKVTWSLTLLLIGAN